MCMHSTTFFRALRVHEKNLSEYAGIEHDQRRCYEWLRLTKIR